MKLLVLILNKIEKRDKILSEFANIGITGATILKSQGMIRALSQSDYKNMTLISSLKKILNPENTDNETILAVTSEEKISKAISAINNIVEGLENPDTGIVFTLPVDNMHGVQE